MPERNELPWWSPQRGWEEFKKSTAKLFPEPSFQPPVSATPQWLTERTRGIMQTPQYEAQEAMRRVAPTAPTPALTPTPTPEPPAWIGQYEPPPHPGKAPEGYDWRWDSATMRYVMKPTTKPTPMPTGLTPAEKERFRLQEEAAAAEEARWREQMEQQEWQREQAEATRAWQEQQATQAGTQWQQQFAQSQMQAQRQYEMQQQQWGQQMQWSQQQAMMQQQEAERRERARLSAQPMSWLQYASYTGETPAIQPWMEPLMGGQAGQAIPGWTPEGGEAMPTLTTPSAQLWGRMGPQAQQMYAGYKQARTGVRPEETAFRMGAGAPPGGRATSLRWTR